MSSSETPALEAALDLIVSEAFTVANPAVVYHYTDWEAVRGLLHSQLFWTTAHDCTNDPAELQSADATIIQVATELLETVPDGAATATLKGFIRNYHTMKVSKQVSAFLGCFSTNRDDAEQWRRYGDEGHGLCVGIRVLNETPPKNPGFGCWLIDVNYSEPSWRQRMRTHFGKVCVVMASQEVRTEGIARGMSALYRIAAMEGVRAKQEQWSVEQEYRLVAVVSKDGVIPKERISGHKTIRYLETLLREEGKRIALAEIIIGPNQDPDGAREDVFRMLAEAGYSPADSETYPEVVRSAATV